VSAAARIDRGILDLTDTLEAMKGLHGGRVRFGAVSTTKYFAAHLIAAFLASMPVSISILLSEIEQRPSNLFATTMSILP